MKCLYDLLDRKFNENIERDLKAGKDKTAAIKSVGFGVAEGLLDGLVIIGTTTLVVAASMLITGKKWNIK